MLQQLAVAGIVLFAVVALASIAALSGMSRTGLVAHTWPDLAADLLPLEVDSLHSRVRLYQQSEGMAAVSPAEAHAEIDGMVVGAAADTAIRRGSRKPGK